MNFRHIFTLRQIIKQSFGAKALALSLLFPALKHRAIEMFSNTQILKYSNTRFFGLSNFQILKLATITLLLASCTTEPLFTELKAEDTGIEFANRIKESDSLNILTFEYIYNGGGVAMGDFNNDNLTDVYFTGNTTGNQLYLNKTDLNGGSLRFENTTQLSGVSGQGRWCSGVSVVDINNDNKLDIYVSVTADKKASKRANLLYVNQGNDKNNVPQFKEMAAEYGIADTTHTTNAAFFDYDNDGDLDLYLVVNEMDDTRFPNQYHDKIRDGSSKRTDRLYRNSPPPPGGGVNHSIFVDVSREAGILIEGYGLGVNIVDINQDGWKDIYVTNDYLTNDLLYINNQKGGFTDQADAYFQHTSHSAMGNDVVDLDNDGLADMIALDMMPATNQRKKMMTPANSYVTYQNNDRFGYKYQYARNTLQWNRGKNPATGQPIFSEIGLLAGVAETDWSWTPMVTDFDNDGLRDIIVTNGFPKDITDQDFLAYRNEVFNLMSKSMLVDAIPSIKIKNFAFKNKGKMAFDNVTDNWGIQSPSFSTGAAYADLDNDGDLDYVVNNINDSALVYRNNAMQQQPDQSHFLRIKLKGEGQNTMGQGAIVEIEYANSQKQKIEYTPYRGYLSTVEQVVHFGIGTTEKINQLKVVWQSGKVQILNNIAANQVLTLEERSAKIENIVFSKNTETPFFEDITVQLSVPFKHEDADVIDFNLQKLMPHKLSQFGPGLAVGDVNGDGLEDVFVGGANHQKGKFLLQSTDGKFTLKDLLPGQDGTAKNTEDMGVLLFDADSDGDNDLYVVSGSYEFPVGSPSLQDRLYINDGKGQFVRDSTALPRFLKSGSCVKAADYDRDGDLDLFIGGRVEPGAYPKAVSSYILRNENSRESLVISHEKENKGSIAIANRHKTQPKQLTASIPKFTDVTAQVAPQLNNIGMVCDALWTDYDNDGYPDLLLAGEWMPLTFLKNNKGQSLTSHNTQLATQIGWWNSLTAGDFDNDGDIDYVAGNLGANTLNRASDKEPIGIYAKDFNKDGFYDVIPTVFYAANDGSRKEFPFNTRDDLAKQLIQTRQRFETYGKFSQATINEIVKPEEIADALILKANYMKSSYIENKGNDQFEIRELPIEAQTAPVFGMIAQDFDQDGNLDVLLTGNDYGAEVSVGRYDSFYGLLLKGNGKGGFVSQTITKSGYCINGDAKALVRVLGNKGKVRTITSQNKGELRFFDYKYSLKTIALKPTEIVAILTLKNGKVRREEIGFGSSFLSQSGHHLVVGSDVQKAEIVDFKGNKRIVSL
jgi:enediyne biosynthesis protein E4